ncbi:MAG: ketoacyl-ACP synthase III [Phycisphaerae bacterium]|nr:ketoacyl-ACP synthase III [Phycisphaerae bacterium]
MSISILGTGRALPDHVLTNADLENRLDTNDEWIRTRTGIQERRIVAAHESTLTLATDAAKDALDDAGLSASDLDLIICATISSEYPFPATACLVQEALGVTEIPAFDLSAACSGFVYGVIQAAHFVHHGTYRHVLVIGAEAMSRFTDYEDRGTCILFGDGAGAAIIGPAQRDGQGIHHTIMGADGSGARMIICPGGGAKEPASRRTVDERMHFLKMRGREVYRFAVTRMQQVIRDAMAAQGLGPEDVAMIVPHQSNLRIIESATEKLGLPPEKVWVNIDRFGNMSGASIPVALDEVMETGRIKPGDWILLAGFGAGLTWASALIRM